MNLQFLTPRIETPKAALVRGEIIKQQSQTHEWHLACNHHYIKFSKRQ